MVWDFTCSDTIASSHIQILSAFPGKVAKSAETPKLTKYCNLSADYEIIPIGVETWFLGSKQTEIDKRDLEKKLKKQENRGQPPSYFKL